MTRTRNGSWRTAGTSGTTWKPSALQTTYAIRNPKKNHQHQEHYRTERHAPVVRRRDQRFYLYPAGRRQKKTLNRKHLSAYLRSPKASLREAAYQEMYRVYEAQQDLLGKSIRPWSTTGRRKIFNCGTSRPRWPRETSATTFPDSRGGGAPHRLHEQCADLPTIFQPEGQTLQDPHDEPLPHLRPHRAEQRPTGTQMQCGWCWMPVRIFTPARRTGTTGLCRPSYRCRTKPGKMGGAYCYSVAPNLTPYVMLNFTGEARDIATMAHS